MMVWNWHAGATTWTYSSAEDPKYCKAQLAILTKAAKCWAISNHLAGQLVSDPNDDSRFGQLRHASQRRNRNAEKKREMGDFIDECARRKEPGHFGCERLQGRRFGTCYSFPPVSDKMVADGFARFAKLWNPILDEFDKCGVKFALEVHPTEIAFDLYTAKRALEALDYRPAFGFNYDPSHLLWQGVDPAQFIREFPDRIYHVHIKDAKVTLDGKSDFVEPFELW